MRRQVPDRRPDGGPGRVDARREEQDHRAEDVLVRQLLPVELGAHEEGREVVAGVRAVVLHLGDEVLLDRIEACHPLLERPVDALEDHVHEVTEQVAVLCWEAEHLGDDAHGDVLCEVDRPVDGSASPRPSSSLVHSVLV